MPVEGESRAAVQDSAGSSACASAAVSRRRSSTPLAAAAARMASSLLDLGGVGGDDQLAAVAERDAARAAEIVEHPLAGHAEARHQAAARVVDAGVDHLAVAAGGLGADALGGLQHQHLAPGLGQGAGDRDADHAGADDHALDLVHPRPCPSRPCRQRGMRRASRQAARTNGRRERKSCHAAELCFMCAAPSVPRIPRRGRRCACACPDPRPCCWRCCCCRPCSRRCRRMRSSAAARPRSARPRCSRQPVTESNDFVGRVQAIDKVDLVSRVTAFLEEIHFTEGTEVKQGDLLYVLERGPFEADVAAKQAAVAQTQALLRNATITLNRAQSLLSTPAGQRSVDDDAQAQQAQLRGAAAIRTGAVARLADQPRLHRNPRPGRRPDHAHQRDRRQRGQPLLRPAGDDLQPGPDVRAVPGLVARGAGPAQPLSPARAGWPPSS